MSPPEDIEWSRQGCSTAGIGCVDCKKKLAENMQKHFAPYVEKRKEILAKPAYVAEVLAAGAAKAGEIAKATMREVRDRLGLWHSP
jgi:tryptophanyl-tRNA synthetase